MVFFQKFGRGGDAERTSVSVPFILSSDSIKGKKVSVVIESRLKCVKTFRMTVGKFDFFG
jgi:hypothetical protein